MSPRFVRSKVARAAALISLAFVAACGSDDVGNAKLKALKTGDSKNRIAEIVGTGPIVAASGADSMRVVLGYRIQKYVANGSMHEILWYRETPGTLEDSLSKTANTPIVLNGDTLVGWGWDFYDKYAEKNGLPNPSKDAARIDSISKAQQAGAPKAP